MPRDIAVYLQDLQIGDQFRTCKYEDKEWHDGRLVSNCQYQRCHCVFEVKGVVMVTNSPRSFRFREVKVVRRCRTKTKRHEHRNRIARYRYKDRVLPKGTIMAYTWVIKVDPLAEALAEFAA